MDVADMDGDGKLDIVCLSKRANSVSVFRNNATPGILSLNSIDSRVDLQTGDTPKALEVGDLNGDGRLEIIITRSYNNSPDSSLGVFRNISSTGTITSSSFVLFPNSSNSYL